MRSVADVHQTLAPRRRQREVIVLRKRHFIAVCDVAEERDRLRPQRSDILLPCVDASCAPVRDVAAFEAPEERCFRPTAGSASSDRQHARHVTRTPVPLLERLGLERSCLRKCDRRPQRAIGQHLSARLAVRQRRVRAERINDQVESAEPFLVHCNQRGLHAAILDANNALASDDLDVRGAHRLVQYAKKRGAMNGDRTPAGAQRAITYVQHDLVRRNHTPVQPLDLRSERTDDAQQSEFVEHREARRLQDQAGSERPWRIELIEYAHAMAGASEQQRGRKSGRTAAADRNVAFVAHSWRMR